jgi:NAD(P)-dependent dehydrogenase (short-subunit alcohol dehydrogenase family)
MGQLSGKTALVTGGSTGIEFATAARSARLSHSATRGGYLPDPLARTHAARGIADALAAALTGQGLTAGS